MNVKIFIKYNFKVILIKNKIYIAQPILLLNVLDSAFNFYLNKYYEISNKDSHYLLDELNKLNFDE